MTHSRHSPLVGENRHGRQGRARPTTPVEDEGLPSDAARRFAEDVAGAFHAQGMPRMPARVLMALTISPTEGMTAAQLREQLGVSPAAISAAVSYAQSVHLVRVRSTPGTRQQVYYLARDDWYRAVISRTAFYSSMADLCHQQADVDDASGNELARRRIDHMGRFFDFLVEKLPPLIAEWDAVHHEITSET